MKINPKYLHLPPHISTSWTQVRALFLKQGDLVVSLVDGTMIAIHGLQQEIIDTIFNAHAAFLETYFSRLERSPLPFQVFQMPPSGNPSQLDPNDKTTMRFSFDNLESMASAMQHNPAQANMPNLPKEMVSKIAEIARVVAPDEVNNMPKAEPHCNCPHCQIARAIHQESPSEAVVDVPNQMNNEEPISDKDLAFQEWDIVKAGDKLYTVSNHLDQNEKYTVFLGDPVGCTCGKPGCEHILAVLKS